MVLRRATGLRLILAAALAVGLLVSAGVASAAPPASLSTELVISADRAVWKPAGHHSKGILTLRGVSPRMAVLATAPRRESAVVPSGFLKSTWRKAIPKSKKKWTKGKRVTNGVLAFGKGADRRLVPVRLELVGSRADGSRFAFRVRPLKTKAQAHTTDRLGLKPRTIDDVTLYVDPIITKAIKALWKALSEFFSAEQGVPPNPTSPGENGETNFNTGGTYAGESGSFGTNQEWSAIEKANWDGAGGSYSSDIGALLNGGGSFAEFTGASYDGLAIFDQPSGTSWGDHISFSSTQVTNSAIYMVSTPELTITDSEFGGLDMRGTTVEKISIKNSLVEGADMTGVVLGSTDPEADRGSVNGAVFLDVTTSRAVTPDDDATANTGGAGASFLIVNTDFSAVSFQDATLTEGAIGLSTFQACSFQSTDLSGSAIVGASPDQTEPGGMFTPNFDGSIFEDVKFDGAEITNVSFAGADFSGGNVSFDGATLNNVDFTGATGLQFVDWTQVTIEGNVYGLAEFGTQLDLRENPEFLRSITFDGEIPAIDPNTGFDIQPGTAFLIDPASGVRLEGPDANGGYAPVDPETGQRLTDQFGDPLIWSENTGLTDTAGNPWEVDYATGEVEGEG